MECDNQGPTSVQTLKSGETVFLYYDHSTGEQKQTLKRNDSLVTSNSTQGSLQSAATQDDPSTMHSIGTQTDHDVLQGSTVAMTTRNSDTIGRDTTNIKSYTSTSTETDLNAIGDRTTLESLLRWALAICTSEGGVAHQDAQELQYSKRSTSPFPLFPQACQWDKTASDSQHSIGLERAQYGNSTKGNNDPSSDVLGESFREDSHHDGDLLIRLHSSTLSDDMHAEEVEHRVTNELQSSVTLSDNLQVNLSSHLDQTVDKQQESSIGNAIYDNLQVNSPHLDQTPGKKQESGIEMAICEHLQAPDNQQKLVSGMELLGDDMHLDQHLPTHASDGTCIKEENVINEEPVVQGVSSVGDNEERNTESNVFYQNSSTCNSSMSTSMAAAVVSDHPCGMEGSTQAEERAYECDVCGQRYRKKSNFNRHVCIHRNEKPFKCDVCHNKFANKTNLKVHMRIHSQEKPYACTICKRRFTQSGSLTTHMRVHTQEKPYACTICKRSFTRSYGLTTHMRVHFQEKPYACTICKRRFTQSSHLATHMRVHSQEKPYACTICKKRFRQSSNLGTHMRIHTGERPYLCQVCGKRFIDQSGLKHHSKVHSREYPSLSS